MNKQSEKLMRGDEQATGKGKMLNKAMGRYRSKIMYLVYCLLQNK